MRHRVATSDELERAIRRFGPDRAPVELRRRGLIPPIAGASGWALTANKGTGSSATIALGSVTSGHLMTVAAINTTGNETISNITNALGGVTWNKFVFSSAGNTTAIVWGVLANSGTDSMTITWSAGSTNASVYGEFSGSAVSGSSQDGSGAGVRIASGTSVTTPTIPVTGPDDLLLNAILQTNGAVTFNSPWTLIGNVNFNVGFGYQPDANSSGSPYAPNATVPTGVSYSTVVAIKAGSGGGGGGTPTQQRALMMMGVGS